MRVKVRVSKAIECEIDDKFRDLAVPLEVWSEGKIPDGLVSECVSAVEKTIQMPFWDSVPFEKALRAEQETGVICSVESAENGETMLEA